MDGANAEHVLEPLTERSWNPHLLETNQDHTRKEAGGSSISTRDRLCEAVAVGHAIIEVPAMAGDPGHPAAKGPAALRIALDASTDPSSSTSYLDCHDRAGLVAVAYESGLITPGESD